MSRRVFSAALTKAYRSMFFYLRIDIRGVLTEYLRWATVKFKREGINILTQHHVERVENVRGST